MRFIFTLLCIAFCSLADAQNREAIAWINGNAIAIEDANADNPLVSFGEKAPEKFDQARVFGFGEATHHGREFTTIRAKFLKYLVLEKGLRIFVIEDDMVVEDTVGQWINGAAFDREQVRGSFTQGIYQNNEMDELLRWIRDFNRDRPVADRIMFYGMDVRTCRGLHVKLREYFVANGLAIDETAFEVIGKYSEMDLAGGKKDQSRIDFPKLSVIENELERNRERLLADDRRAYLDIIRTVEHFKGFALFTESGTAENPFLQRNIVRDSIMFRNVMQLLEAEGPDAKVMIWAHNEHINNTSIYNSGHMLSTGARLKKQLGDGYYSVGSDFGSGVLLGIKSEKGPSEWVYRKMDKPFKNTFAETLFQADADIFFLDFTGIGPGSKNFFNARRKQLFVGGSGFIPDSKQFLNRNYREAYDGLVFVRGISMPTF